MSLVAYDASSDEENSSDGEIDAAIAVVTHCFNTNILSTTKTISIDTSKTSHISDSDDENGDDDEEDEIFFAGKFGAETTVDTDPLKQNFAMNLPKPKNTTNATNTLITNDDSLSNQTTTDDCSLSSVFSKLPPPKYMEPSIEIIEEEYDEFLAKKPTSTTEDKPPVKPLTKPATQNSGKVKITIPSMKDFRDVDLDIASKSKIKSQTNNTAIKKGSGLLSLLPVAKSEQNFGKNKSNDVAPNESVTTTTTTAVPKKLTATVAETGIKVNALTAFVPNVIKTQRVGINTEGVDGIKTAIPHRKNAVKIKTITNTTPTETAAVTTSSDRVKQINKTDVIELSDNDGSDNEEDFFSLNAAEEKLPDISANEINAMVAKRAAKMSETTNKYLNILAEEKAQNEALEAIAQTEAAAAQKRQQSTRLNSEAMEALVGRKRRRMEENIDIIDISGEEVLPNHDEWMRTTLASSTAYQPTGVLVDEEPVAGTRRKHQITYLAHKAKANEAELQAMWSANRHSRRATQSKYGF